MAEEWKYINDRGGEYPEAYFLSVDGNKIKIELNREKKQVKLFADTESGKAIESSITNGVIIEEKNVRTGKPEDLYEEFSALSEHINGVPDSKVIRLIGGNYGVIHEYQSFKTIEEFNLLKKLHDLFTNAPQYLFLGFLSLLRSLLDRPTIADVLDSMAVVTGGYLVYLINFNYVFGGAFLAAGALAAGYIDWMVRKRQPYIFKVIAISIPAFYAISVGLRYQ
ncbi:MAG: hypothetical protein OEV66_09160 [Spirochaetia bacterium]|nr:hypothetical protein [Spirochaetia bacterium]